MRVLMTADAVGGIWNYSLTLAKWAAGIGVEYTLAVMGPAPSGSQRAEAELVPGLRLYDRDFRLEWMENPWTDVDAAGDWLQEIAGHVRPDIVHLNGYSHAALDLQAPKIIVAHSCVCSWWRAVHGQTAPACWDEYRRRVRAGLEAADLVIAPTAAMLGAIELEYGSLHGQGRIIENAAEVPCTGPAQGDEVVFAAARFRDESKNFKLLEQIALVISWPLIVAGDSPRSKHITALNWIDHSAVLDRMSRAGIFCHPALYEPFGLAPLEAALSGCALALADIPTLREIWGDAAVFFNPRDPRSAAAAVNSLIFDSGFRRSMAQFAAARASRFTPAVQAGKYLEAYTSAIAFSGRETAVREAWQT